MITELHTEWSQDRKTNGFYSPNLKEIKQPVYCNEAIQKIEAPQSFQLKLR